MQNMLGWARRGAALIMGLLACGSAWAYTGAKWNLPEGVTEISKDVHRLHMMIFWVCVVIAVVVFGAMFYSVFAHRKSRHPKPADFHESTTVEIIWTAIPFFILIVMAIPAAATLVKMDDTRGADMSVKITGYQWKWHYDYLGENVAFFSTLAAESNKARQLQSGIDVTQVPNYLVEVDKPLVLPVGKKVRFLITANDVIHSWWVPTLAVKKDAIPGYVNEVWAKIEEPGLYRGVCAELCGRDHGFMPIVVQALPEAEYQAWLSQQKSEQVASIATGPAAGSGGVAPQPAEPSSGSTAADTPAPGAAAGQDQADAAISQVAAAPASAAPEAAPAAGAKSKDELMAAGQKIFAQNCAACHQANGAGLPPTFPSLIGSPKIKGPPVEQIKQVINGKPPMPPFGHLSDADIAAVVTYTRNSWGNSTGVVQADEVKAAR